MWMTKNFRKSLSYFRLEGRWYDYGLGSIQTKDHWPDQQEKTDQYNQRRGYVLTDNFGGALDHIDKPANAIDHCQLNPGNCDQYAAIDQKRAIKRPALIA